MNLLTLPADCLFDARQLTPLLVTLRARVTGDRAAFNHFAPALRAATARNPFEAYLHASATSAAAGRRLRKDFSVGDMLGQAMLLGDFFDQKNVPAPLGFPALAPTAALIKGRDVDPAEFLGDDPVMWARAALVNQVVAPG